MGVLVVNNCPKEGRFEQSRGGIQNKQHAPFATDLNPSLSRAFHNKTGERHLAPQRRLRLERARMQRKPPTRKLNLWKPAS